MRNLLKTGLIHFLVTSLKNTFHRKLERHCKFHGWGIDHRDYLYHTVNIMCGIMSVLNQLLNSKTQ